MKNRIVSQAQALQPKFSRFAATYSAPPKKKKRNMAIINKNPQETPVEARALQQLDRLNNLFLLLNHVSALICNAHTPDKIYGTVCKAALRDAGFILAWVGILNEAGSRIIPDFSCGAAAEHVKAIEVTINPNSKTGQDPTQTCLLKKTIVYTDDFQSDPRTVAWHEIGQKYGINSSAYVPVIVSGKAISALSFYSSEKAYFSPLMLSVLEQISHNVSLALQSITEHQQRNFTEMELLASEDKLKQIFDVSPLPMLIVSLSSGKTLALNQAHRRTFGYDISDIPDEAAWFAKVYPDPLFRNQIMELWRDDLQQEVSSGANFIRTSPEISLRCKDGKDRIVRGFMSISGDNVIVQWQDLTEIKHNEARMAEHERQFRNLIEQAIAGFYVHQDGRLVYINPRMCEIIGFSADEISGKDTLKLFAYRPESRQKILEARKRLYAGEHSVQLVLPVKHKDGREISLETHASLGIWDGKPVVIVMAQDITEKLRAEEKISAYVKQLEGTMEGTLRALSNMVSLRDPYTAGHEQRVGVIAEDIARELGWPNEKCMSLQLIGLVHDIGKIAIPSEILTKPTRLTALEYELVKTHAQISYEILKNIEFPLPIAEIVRTHHERMDGSGYPQGLKGEEILFEARILAVADVLESMASHRPYRPALGIDKALKEIEGHRGTLYDATVVDALLRLIREKGYQLPKHADV
jgi:PAS domain S-box-containing protein/putative nucleotidyltransferase with HDIG domain